MGLGIGLILGASMLQLILAAKEQAGNAAELPMTREQLEEEASRANFVVYPKDETLYTEEQLQVKLEEAAAKAETEKESEPEPSESAKATDEPASEEESASNAAPQSEEQPSSGTAKEDDAKTGEESVKLYVSPKMTLQEVGKKLEELGVVADGADFVAQSKAIATKLDVGTAVFSGKPTYEEIRQELTRKKP